MINSMGHIFRLTTFGESHGSAIGGVIDGCPSNMNILIEEIQNQLNKRKPGQSSIVTQRKELDQVEILSGVFDGKTTGAPIGFIIKNSNQKSKDYSHLKYTFRPSHADYTYQKKYKNRDYAGGGRSSARETANWVVAGAIAKQILDQLIQPNINITAFVSQVGKIQISKNLKSIDLNSIEKNVVRCPDERVAEDMITYIKSIKKKGDTVGGQITCVIEHCPVGIGEPVFDKLNANLAKAMFSINAVKGFELGSGFKAITQLGSEHNDLFYVEDGVVKTHSNHSGGIQGGISNGEPIYFNVAFKPVATLMQPQPSINDKMETVTLEPKGRHDACVVPRAVPIVEALSAMVLLDLYLLHKSKN